MVLKSNYAKIKESEKTFSGSSGWLSLWNYWPFNRSNSSSGPNVPQTTNDVESKQFEEKMAQQKREFKTTLKGKWEQMKDNEKKENLIEVREQKRDTEAEKQKALLRPILPLTYKDVERNIEDEMAELKRKYPQMTRMLAEKDDQIDKGQKRLKTLEGQIIAFQENLKQTENYISELQMDNNKLISKLKATEQNQRDTNKELCDVREKKNEAEAKTKHKDNQIGILKMKQKELVSTLEQTERERVNFYNDLLIAQKQLHDTEEKLFEVREQKRETEGKKHESLLRSGEMVSDICFYINPDIVHLSDEYRPTKLAEMFSELYDEEWTAAYTVMEKNEFQDRQMIDFLLDVVMESYIFCKDEVEYSWNVVSKWFPDSGLPKVQQMRKALKDGRNLIALKLLPDIEQKYTSYLEGICRNEHLKELLSSEDIRKYMALCVKLTLLMTTNDPPVYLECSGWKPIRDRQEEDKDLLEREHSVSKLPGNGKQPENQNDEDQDSCNVVETDKQEEAFTGNCDSGQDLNNDDTENKDAALKDQIERLENNAKPGVTGDSGLGIIENGGQIGETNLNSVNDAGQNIDVKREEPQQIHDTFQSEDDQGSMYEKITREMENDTRLCEEASIDPDATSPTNDEDDTQKTLIYNNNFEEHPETTECKDENDMPDSNSPNSGLDLHVKQLKHEYVNDDSKQIYAREISKEEIAAVPRREFEKDKYKEFTTRGIYTEFHVWPIVYLHKDGPILSKGIAQGLKDGKAKPIDKPWAWWK